MATLLRFSPFELDLHAGTLHRDGVQVSVQPRAVDLIRFLAEREGQVLSRQELLEGIWPGVHVGEDALHQMLRRARLALEDDPAQPQFIETIPRRGWRWVAPVERTTPDADTIGRRLDLLALQERLEGTRAVVLHGPAGVGKTHLARRVAKDWPGEVLWLELGSASTRLDVELALFAALQAQAGAEALLDACGRALQARSGCLVVLDSTEQLALGWEELVTRLREAAPDSTWLITTQIPSPHLSTHQELRGLRSDDAVALLLRRSGIAHASPVLAELAEQLDRLPLALELAAPRLSLLSPQEILQRIQRSSLLLRRQGAGRHDSISAALTTSWQLLTLADQEALLALAWPEQPFDLETAEALLGEDAPDRLEVLLKRALLGYLPDRRRYQLPQRVRVFAAERAEEQGRAAQLRRAWQVHVAQRAEALHQRAWRTGTGTSEIAEFIPALRQIVLQASAPAALVAQATVAASWHLRIRGPLQEARALLDAAAAHEAELSPESFARLRYERAAVASRQSNQLSALALSQEGARRAQQAGLSELALLLDCQQAAFLTLHGEHQAALQKADETRAIALRTGNAWIHGFCAITRGMALHRLGEASASLEAIQEGLLAAESAGDRSARLVLLLNAGVAWQTLARSDEAEAALLEATQEARRLDHTRLTIVATAQLAVQSYQLGRPTEALQHSSAGLLLARPHGDLDGTSTLEASYATALLGLGQREEGRARLLQALLRYGALRPPWYRGMLELRLALLALLEGTDGDKRLLACLPLLARCPHPDEEPAAIAIAAARTAAQGDPERAAAMLDGLAPAGPSSALVLDIAHAHVALARGEPARARALLPTLPAARWSLVTLSGALLQQALEATP